MSFPLGKTYEQISSGRNMLDCEQQQGRQCENSNVTRKLEKVEGDETEEVKTVRPCRMLLSVTKGVTVTRSARERHWTVVRRRVRIHDSSF